MKKLELNRKTSLKKIRSTSYQQKKNSSNKKLNIKKISPKKSFDDIILGKTFNFGNNEKIKLGICAMEKKTQSISMKNILKLIKEQDPLIEIIIFSTDIIFNKNIENWPIIDVFLCFFSEGFPLTKAEAYVELRKPYLINDVKKQKLLWDRQIIYKNLKKYKIPVAEHVFVDYSPFKDPNKEIDIKTSGKYFKKNNSQNSKEENEINEVKEFDNYIIINGKTLNKPIVEKPRNSENHDIRIYYPMKEGGGTKYLFRKIKNTSSKFLKNKNGIRKKGNFIYEKFLQSDGFDIKVYAIGTDYFHSEARKSPIVDGKVERRKDGRECRYQVNLTPYEKSICRKIVMIFDQQVCGFDIIRSNEKSFVCDVNGWSFVKGNKKYTQDCAFLLRSIIYKKFKPNFFNNLKLERELISKSEIGGYHFRPKILVRREEELRSVIGIFRHEDRTPKQKMKMLCDDERILNYFPPSSKKPKEIKMKSAKLLQGILNFAKAKLNETIKKIDLNKKTKKASFSDLYILESETKKEKQEDINTITEKKQKSLPNIKNRHRKKSLSETQKKKNSLKKKEEKDRLEDLHGKLNQIIAVLEINGHFEGINRKIQLRPKQYIYNPQKEIYIIKNVLFILKWGGEITHSGIRQAEKYGKIFRANCYPKKKDGLLRLHSTYRHDLKVYSADEGRCQITAGAFIKGLLKIEEDITPIISSFVNCDEKAIRLLDYNKKHAETSFDHSIQKSNPIIETAFSKDIPLTDSIKDFVDFYSLNLAKDITNPVSDLKKIYDYLKNICESLQQKFHLNVNYYISPSDILKKNKEVKICGSENLILFAKRWSKLYSDFYNKKQTKFNLSKIPEINDALNYDILHNLKMLKQLNCDYKSFKKLIKKISEFYIQFEYGLTKKNKLELAEDIISPLLKKIISDLTWWNSEREKLDKSTLNKELNYYIHRGLKSDGLESDIKSAWRHIRTRLYFTCASHIYSLFYIFIFDQRKNDGSDNEEMINDKNKNDIKKNNKNNFLGKNFINIESDKNIKNEIKEKNIKNEIEEKNKKTEFEIKNNKSVFKNKEILNKIIENPICNYFTHFVFRLYENLMLDKDDENRFRIELGYCSGVNDDAEFSEKDHAKNLSKFISINNNIKLQDFILFLNMNSIDDLE